MTLEYPQKKADHRTLEERITAFYGMPIDQIPRAEDQEVDWGKPEGDEL